MTNLANIACQLANWPRQRKAMSINNLKDAAEHLANLLPDTGPMLAHPATFSMSITMLAFLRADDSTRRASGPMRKRPSSEVATTSHEYDDAGHMISLTDPNGHVTTWEFDDQGREVLMTDPLGQIDPEGHTVTKTYDEDGRLASIVNRNGLLRNHGNARRRHVHLGLQRPRALAVGKQQRRLIFV